MPDMPDIIKKLIAHEVRKAKIRQGFTQSDDAALPSCVLRCVPLHVWRRCFSCPHAPPLSSVCFAPCSGTPATPAKGSGAAMAPHILAQIGQGPEEAPVVKPVRAGPVGQTSFLSKHRQRTTRGRRAQPRSRFLVYFKFQEGFTQAVRRPVVMRDLL